MDSSTERRDDDATTCEACEKAYSKYSCPKCGAKLCALACYERHNDGRCRSAFHENELARAMRGLTATSETRTAMMESLKRQAFADGTLDLASASEGEGEGEEEDEEGDGDGDGERCVLSEKSLEVLRLGGELDPEKLNEEERASFERAIASGELVKPWEAWWESPEAGRPRASARGAPAVAEVREDAESTSTNASADDDLPPLANEDELLDPFDALSGGREAPEVLRWHCVNALAAYVLVKRVFNGDWRDEESEACDAALDASIVLAAERVGPIPEVQCARDAVLSVVRRASPADVAPRAAVERALLRDLTALFAAAPTAPIRAFLDLIRCLRLAAAVGPRTERAPRVRAARKARYLASHPPPTRAAPRETSRAPFATSPTARATTKTTKTTKTKTSTASAHRPSRLASTPTAACPRSRPRARARTPSYKTHTLAQQINVVSHRPMVEERRADIHRVHHFPIFTSHDSTCTPSFPRGSRRVMNARVSLFTHTHGDRFPPPGAMPIIIAPIGRPADWTARRQNAPDARSSSARASERTHASSRPGAPVESRGRLATPSSSVVVEFIHRPSKGFDSIRTR